MQASLKNYRQAPRKVRLLADLVRGKNVNQAIMELSFLPKRASLPMKKLIESAVANAKAQSEGIKQELLFVKTATVDKGLTLHRSMPRARGRASAIHKESSHVHIFLEERAPEDKKIKTTRKKVAKKATKNETQSSEK